MSDRISAITTWIAGVVSFLVGLGIPSVYFLTTFQHERAVVSTAAEITSRSVSNFAGMYPGLWPFMEERLQEIIYRGGGDVPKGISKNIYDENHNLVIEIPYETQFPTISLEKRFLVEGKPVGYVALKHSVRPLAIKTALALIVGMFAGLMVFYAMRRLPLQALNRALADLYEEKERTGAILKSIGDAVITCDRDLCIVTANLQAEVILRTSQDQLNGASIQQVFSGSQFKKSELLPSFFRRVIHQGEIIIFPEDIIHKAEERRYLSLSGAPVRDNRGSIVGGVFVIRDATERHQLQDEKLKLQQLESLGVLAGGIAHDFNNLLALILGNTEMVAHDMDPDNPDRKLLYNACESIEHARELTARLLTFSSGGAPLKEEADLPGLIVSRCDPIVAGSGIDCFFNFPESLFPVSIDQVQMGQVVQNLVLNALEAMPEGGKLHISGDNHILGEDNVLQLPPGPYVRITFQDSGPGIPPEDHTKIFEPYYSTKTRGTQRGMGLGLATCLSIAKKHEGNISLESEPGKGARFRVFIPAA